MHVKFKESQRTDRRRLAPAAGERQIYSGLTIVSGFNRPSHIFGRCAHCRGLTIRGVCQQCGFATVCCYCGKTQQPDKLTWSKVQFDKSKASHGVCPICTKLAIMEARNAPN